ncbi:hypothetical protein REPUB_Repub13aG0048100 [Reevesia pubescens]
MFSVFVSNIPQKVHWRWLWKIFANHGRVVDVFIPKNRNGVSGKRFGFVRFVHHEEALSMIRKLNGVWLLNSKISVKMARSNGRTSYWRRVQKRSTSQADDVEVSS